MSNTIRGRFVDERNQPLGSVYIVLDKPIKNRNVVIFLSDFRKSSTLIPTEMSDDYYNTQVDINIVSMIDKHYKIWSDETKLALILKDSKKKFLHDTSNILRSRESIEKEMKNLNTERKQMASVMKTYFENLLGIKL